MSLASYEGLVACSRDVDLAGAWSAFSATSATFRLPFSRDKLHCDVDVQPTHVAWC